MKRYKNFLLLYKWYKYNYRDADQKYYFIILCEWATMGINIWYTWITFLFGAHFLIEIEVKNTHMHCKNSFNNFFWNI
jgi:hypothetical protein